MEAGASAQMRTAEQQVKEIFKKKLEQSIKENNTKEILRLLCDRIIRKIDASKKKYRFCCLYVPIGMKDEGLLRYSHYLRGLISSEGEALQKQLLKSFGRSQSAATEKDELITCVDAMTKLFEAVAETIEKYSSIMETNFGEGSTLILLKEMQLEADIHSTKMIDVFIEHFNISKIMSDIGTSAAKKKGESQIVDSRLVDSILEEISFLSQRSEIFDRFIRTKAKIAMETINRHHQQSQKVVREQPKASIWFTSCFFSTKTKNRMIFNRRIKHKNLQPSQKTPLQMGFCMSPS